MVNGKPWVAHVTTTDIVGAAFGPQAIPNPQLTFYKKTGESSCQLL
jgi:hypothetical protein